MARAAFGDQVVNHYLNYARTEQGLFDRFVTDWERSATSSESEAIPTPRAKRALDVAVSGSLLVALTPVWAVVLGAVASTCSATPATAAALLYREPRISGGRTFDLLKLRTLREDVSSRPRGTSARSRPTWAISPGRDVEC